MKQFFLWGICIAVSIFLIYSCSSDGTISREEYQRKIKSELNNELMSPSSDFRRAVYSRVEAAHGTVTVRSAEVSKCYVKTLDGGDTVKEDGSNVLSVDYDISTIWDGFIHKGGRTVLNILQQRNGKGEYDVISAKIIKTDAMVNTEDPNFWYDVGFAAGVLLAL